jgi:hypothetical protein
MYIPPLDVSITPPCPPLTKGRIVPGVIILQKIPLFGKEGKGEIL